MDLRVSSDEGESEYESPLWVIFEMFLVGYTMGNIMGDCLFDGFGVESKIYQLSSSCSSSSLRFLRTFVTSGSRLFFRFSLGFFILFFVAFQHRVFRHFGSSRCT